MMRTFAAYFVWYTTSVRRFIIPLFLFLCLLITEGSNVLRAAAQTQATAQAFSRNLQLNDQGNDVSALQSFLIANGYLAVPAPTGYFGQKTYLALEAWQGSVGLPQTGFFGPMSRAAIAGNSVSYATVPSTVSPQTVTPTPAPVASPAPTSVAFTRDLQLTDTGSDVSALQTFLMAKGLLNVPAPTGYFGQMTYLALQHWQASVGVSTTGYFGPLTRASVSTSLASGGSTTSQQSGSVTPNSSFVAGPSSIPPTTSQSTVPNSSNPTPVPPTPVPVLGGGGGGGGGGSPPSPPPPPAPSPTPAPVDVTLPSVSITSPSNNSSASSTILVTATASDASGIASVQFMLDASILGPALTNTNTYQVSWNTASSTVGTHTLSAVAKDKAGNSSTSTKVTVTVVRATSTPTPAPPPAPPPPPPSSQNYSFGFSVGETMLGLSTTALNTELSDVASLGVGWLRIDMDWGHVQPNDSSNYSWGNIDTFVAAANAHNIKVLAILDYAPAWAQSSSCPGGTLNCPPNDPQQFATYAKAAVARYAPQGVHTWEIWNEPNLGSAWQPSGANAQQYVNLIKAVYPAIKSADPTAIVMTGGMAPALSANGNIAPVDFLQQVYADGGKNYFDAVGMHPYSFPAMPGYYQIWNSWQQMASTSPSLRSIMAQNGDSSKKIWMTEYGAPTGGPGVVETSSTDTTFSGGPDHVTEALQAQMISQAVSLHDQYSWAGPMLIYSYKDIGTSQSTIENFFGLRRNDNSQKPAYAAYKSAVAASSASQ